MTGMSSSSSLTGAVKDAYFGYSVTIGGDIDRNGKADLLVGAPYELINDKRMGAAYVVLIGADGKLPADKNNQYNVVRMQRSSAGVGFGARFASGNLNGDSRIDIVVASGIGMGDGGGDVMYRRS